MTYELNITPNTKPRMTRSDKWKVRPCVMQYRAFKDQLKLECKKAGLTTLSSVQEIVFYIPMPDSWSKQKKINMCLQPHQQSPDLDNLIKGIWDALLDQDNYIYSVKATKKWASGGSITIIQED